MNRTPLAKKRIKVALYFLVFLHALIILRAIYIEQVYGDELRERRFKQSKRIIPQPARRGFIYDRNGNKLAMDVPFLSIFAVPSMINHPSKYAREISRVLGVPPAVIQEKLSLKKKSFVWLARMVSDETGERIKNLNLKGLVIIRESKRMYPNGQAAACVVGMKGHDKGIEGSELVFEKWLHGIDGYVLLEKDPLGRNIPNSIREKKPVRHGNDVYLTLDMAVQHFAEKALADSIEKFNAAGGSALVMEPRTGKILAMASQPTFNPNEYTKYVDERVYFRNKPIWYMYEPGSTMKPITVASAVDAGVVEPFEKSIMCEHAIQVNGWTIRDEHGDLPGLKSPLDIIVNSFNTGAARIAMKMGSQTLQSYFARFNFGRYYDFPLNGQSRGILPDYKEAREVTIANNGFGHGISVTQLQMAMAIAAIANGGLIMKPTIVEKIVDPITQTPIQEFEPKVVRRAVKEETSRVVRYMMHMVTEQGTGEKAKIPGYRVAGKTGTAQVAGNHGYMAGQYISSFVGFAPAEDPQVLVMVTIEKPRGSYYAAEVAAPAFKEIMKKTLWHLEIPPSPPEKEPLGY